MSARHDSRVPRLLRLALLLAGSGAALPAAAQRLPYLPLPVEEDLARVPDAPEEALTMVLAVRVNGTDTGRLIPFAADARGRFSAHAADLRAIRIRLDPALADEAPVALDALPGLTYSYDEPRQAIALHAPDALMTAYDVNLGGRQRATNLSGLDTVTGLVLNYGLYGTAGSGDSSVSGSFEALGLTHLGTFSTTGLYNNAARQGGAPLVRLDSAWQWIDPVRVRSYAAGDFATGALGWTRSVRLAGLQMQSAFEQRSDLVTTVLPQFSGSAALPSTLDVYVNSMRLFTGQVPAGPFDIRSLPSVTGGEVRMVTTDATGRQVEMTGSYYYAPGLLRPGLSEYSIDLGFPRREYGLSSFRYDGALAGSASLRHGLTRHTTIEAHAEGSSDGLAQGGIGIVQGLGGLGALTASAAASRYRGDTGGRVKLQGDFRILGIRAFAGVERNIGTYFDLTRAQFVKEALRRPERSTDWFTQTAMAEAVDRAGISFRPWFDRTTVSLSYNRIRSPGTADSEGDGGDTLRLLNLSASRGLSSRLSLFATGFLDLDQGGNYGLFATLNIRIGNGTNGALGIERNASRTGYTAQVSHSDGQGQGALSWGLADREYDDGSAWRTASLGYRAGFATLRGQIDETGGRFRGSAQVEGSLVMAGGELFTASRIGTAFALVEGAGPDTPIRQGGTLMARTGRDGTALLPQLSPYYPTQVSIDPTNLPEGLEPTATSRTAIAGYRQATRVDFGVRQVRGAVIVLIGRDGKPLPAGYVTQLDGTEETAIIGFDGEAYLRGLADRNRISVDLGPGGTCHADFAYPSGGDAQPRIGPLTCQ